MMSRLDTNGYYALGVPAYLVLIGLEWAWMRRQGQRVFVFADTIGNLSAGLGEVAIGILLGPLLFALYQFGYTHVALIHWADGAWAPWVLAFVVSDLCYYWYHRAGHALRPLWAIHGVHHQGETFNVSIALRHPWLSDSYSALFYVPLPLLGVSPTQFFFAISCISFYAISVHSRAFNRPSLGIFVTPATHVVHHAKNPRYYGRNLGAMLIVWDKLFGTYAEVEATDPPVIGGAGVYETHDGAKAQWVYWRALLRKGRPAPARARGDATIPRGVKAYVGAQFLALAGGMSYVFWRRDGLSTGYLCAAIALMLWSTSTLGGLLDGRNGAKRFEAARLGVLALAWGAHLG